MDTLWLIPYAFSSAVCDGIFLEPSSIPHFVDVCDQVTRSGRFFLTLLPNHHGSTSSQHAKRDLARDGRLPSSIPHFVDVCDQVTRSGRFFLTLLPNHHGSTSSQHAKRDLARDGRLPS